MKKTTKKIWGAVLTLMMVLSLLPTSAFAEEKVYPVWVGDVQVSEENKDNVLGDGTVKFDPKTSTLTLSNAKITAPKGEKDNDTSGIWSTEDLNILLKGQNTIYSVPAIGENANSIGILAYDYDNEKAKDLTIAGDGSLMIYGAKSESDYGTGIGAEDLKIKSGTVTIKDIPGKKDSVGLDLNGNFKMLNGKLMITTKNARSTYGLFAGGNIDIQAGDIQIKTGDALGTTDDDGYTVAIKANKKLDIRGGNVQVIAGDSKENNSQGIYSLEDMTISGGTIEAKTGKNSWSSLAILSDRDVLVKNGRVTAEGTTAAIQALNEVVIEKGKVTAKAGNDEEVAIAIWGSNKVTIKGGEVYAESMTGKKLRLGIASVNNILFEGDELAFTYGEGIEVQGGNIIAKGVTSAFGGDLIVKDSLKTAVKISKEIDGKDASQWDGKQESIDEADFVHIGSKTTTDTTSSSAINGAIKLKIGSKEMIKQMDGADKKTMMDAAPFVSQGRTMVPLRYVAEALGLEVKMDTASKSVVLSNADKKIQIPLNSLKMMANDKEVMSDVLPIVKEGRTYLSISNIGKALGLESGKNLIWDAKAKEITVIP